MATGTQTSPQSETQRNVSHQEKIERITSELKNLTPEQINVFDDLAMEFRRSRDASRSR